MADRLNNFVPAGFMVQAHRPVVTAAVVAGMAKTNTAKATTTA